MFFILKTTSFNDYGDDSTMFVVRDNTANVTETLAEIGKHLEDKYKQMFF